MTDVKDNWLDTALGKIAIGVDKRNDITLRNVSEAKQTILEEMDRVVAEVIGEDVPPEQVIANRPFFHGINNQKENSRHRWQEVRGKLI